MASSSGLFKGTVCHFLTVEITVTSTYSAYFRSENKKKKSTTLEYNSEYLYLHIIILLLFYTSTFTNVSQNMCHLFLEKKLCFTKVQHLSTILNIYTFFNLMLLFKTFELVTSLAPY